MHVLIPDRKYSWISGVARFLLLLIVTFAFLSYLLSAMATDFGAPPSIFDFTQSMFQSVVLVFIFVALVVLMYSFVASGSGKCRAILTARTLAIKIGKQAPIFIKRDDCVAYGPEKLFFVMQDDSQWSLYKLNLPKQNIFQINRFIFTHWWSTEFLENMNHELNVHLPERQWRFRIGVAGMLAINFTIAIALLASTIELITTAALLGYVACTMVPMIVVILLLHSVAARRKERAAYRVYFPGPIDCADKPQSAYEHHGVWEKVT